MSTLVIIGSSRADGEKAEAVAAITHGHKPALVDLSTKRIGYYDYGSANEGDDFLAVAEAMAEARHIVFATPVYWYAMSAQLKTFLDRFTDLITTRKELGRKLKGKHLSVLAWGHDPELPAGFETPFAATADYFGMGYGGCFYYCTGRDADVKERGREAEAFRHRLFG